MDVLTQIVAGTPDPSPMPRLHRPLLVLAALLLAGALGAEAWRSLRKA